MAITGKFLADFASFEAAVQKAEVSLRGFEQSGARVATSLTKMSNSLNGTRTIQDATVMARAVEKIGGVSKLTQSELQRLGTQAQEAIAKMKAIGVGVPENLQKIADASRRASVSLQDVQQGLQRFGQAAQSIGAGLTATITAPLVGAGVGAVKLAMDFESSFAGVRKTVDATDDEFAQMAQAFRNLSKEIPINVNELNRLGEAAGALGIPKAEIVDFARVMALVGQTTNVTADHAAESIAKIQNIFGAAGKDTERFASTLVALGNDGASTEAQILEMATRIAGAGNAIGITQGQVLAFASALSSVGIEAEMGGSAISRVFIDIAGAVSKGGSDLKGFADVAGKSMDEFARLFKSDAATATNEFITGLGRIKQSGGDVLATLEALGFSEIRVRDTLLRAAGAGDLLTNALKLQGDAWRANTALTNEAQKRFETTASQMTLLWTRIKDVGITIGNALLPGIRSMVSVFNTLLPVVDTAAKFFAVMPGSLQLLSVGFIALAAAIGPVIYVAGQLAISSAAIAGLFTAETTATGLLTLSKGALTTAYTVLLTPITLSTIAVGASTTAMGLATLASSALTAGLGLLRGALLLITAHPLVALATAVAGAVLAWSQYKQSVANAELSTQTMAAQQDTINAAVRRGADATIKYAEAVKFNTEWNDRYTESLKAATAANELFVGPIESLASKNVSLSMTLAKANDEIRKLSATTRNELVKAIQSGAFSIKEMAEGAGISELAVKLFQDQLKGAGQNAKALAKDLNETVKEMVSFRNESVAAAHAVAEGLKGPLNVLRDMMKQIAVMHDSRIIVKVGFTTDDAKGLPGAGNLPSTSIAGLSGQNVGTIAGLKGIQQHARASQEAIEKLSQAFAQLAQVGGGSFGGIIQNIGQMVSGFNLAQQSIKQLGAAAKASFVDMAASAISLITAVYSIGSAVERVIAEFLPEARPDYQNFQELISAINASGVTFEEYAAKARAAGVTQEQFNALLDADTAQEFAKAMRSINKTLDEFAAKEREINDAMHTGGAKSNTELQHEADVAREAFERAMASGDYTAENLLKLEIAYQKAIAAMGGAAGKAAEEWLKAHEAAVTGADKVDAALQKLLDRRDELTKSIDAEAPEAHMGVVEAQQRAERDRIEKQIEEAKKAADATSDAMGDAAKRTEKHFHDASDEVERLLREAAERAKAGIADTFNGFRIRIPIEFNTPGLPVVPMASGGSGTVTKPTLFLAGEAGVEQYAFSGANKQFGSRVGGSGLDDEILQALYAILDATSASRVTSVQIQGRELVRAHHDVLANNEAGLLTDLREIAGMA